VSKSILAIDIGTTNIVSIIAQNNVNNKINILGVGQSISDGIKKGAIVDIDLASKCIKNSVDLAKTNATTEIDTTYISISGIHTKSIRRAGSITIHSGLITLKEITQVLAVALYDAQIVPEYEAIHVIPLFFKVDNNDQITNPLNMNGSRLEVYVNIITAKKTSLTNIKSALKSSNIDNIIFVLSSYASTISTIQKDQINHGIAVLDLGGSTSELSIFKNNAVLYNDIVPLGSEHISSDISIMLNTPFNAASEVKKKYASLIPNSESSLNTITKVKVPILGNETEQQEKELESIQIIVHVRVEEILCLAKNKLTNSTLYETIQGIILTGGMSKIPGIELLAQKVFPNIPIKISNPKNIENGYINFNNPTLSTIVGLLLYGLDTEPTFELNSNKKLRKRYEEPKIKQLEDEISINQDTTNTNSTLPNEHELQNLEIDKKDSKSIIGTIIKKFSEWF
jgi:cell division protein FtsA